MSVKTAVSTNRDPRACARELPRCDWWLRLSLRDVDERTRTVRAFNGRPAAAELASRDQSRAYAELFTDIPGVGLATYGESYIGHLSQTSTMLLFA